MHVAVAVGPEIELRPNWNGNVMLSFQLNVNDNENASESEVDRQTDGRAGGRSEKGEREREAKG